MPNTQGPACSDRGYYGTAGYWAIQTSTGTAATTNFEATCIKAWAYTTSGGIETGSYAYVSGNNFTGNGNCDGASLTFTAGSCVSKYSSANFTKYNVASGEYLGSAGTSGLLEEDTSGGQLYYKSGTSIITGSVTMDGSGAAVTSIQCSDETIATVNITETETLKFAESLD